MSWSSWSKSPTASLRVGMSFLILAGVSHVFLRTRTWLSPDHVDGLTGLCTGIAIATLLLSVARNRRQDSSAP